MVEDTGLGGAATQPGGAARGRFIRLRLVAVGLLAGLASVALGAWVVRTWPNPVYGMHAIALGLALLLALAGALVLRRGPIGQAFAVASFAGLVGVFAGLTFFEGPAPQYASGTVTLRLEQPFDLTREGIAECAIDGDSRSVWVEFEGLPTEERHSVVLVVSEGEAGDDLIASRADGRRLEMTLEGMGSKYEGDLRGVILYATDASALEGRVNDAGGNVRFGDLAVSTFPPGPPTGLDDLGLAGTVEWVCGGYQAAWD